MNGYYECEEGDDPEREVHCLVRGVGVELLSSGGLK